MQQNSFIKDVARYGAGLRRSGDFQNLDHNIRASTDTTFNEVHGLAARLDAEVEAMIGQAAVDQHGAEQDPQAAAVRAAAMRTDVFAAAERAAAHLDRQKEKWAADLAAHDARCDDITSGRMVPDGKGGHTRQPPAAPLSADEARRRQGERAALRAQPQADVERQYLDAIANGNNSRLVTLVETAPQSLPVVRKFTRDRASQIRMQNSPAAAHVTQTRQALELRDFVIGHASRAIEAFIGKVTAK